MIFIDNQCYSIYVCNIKSLALILNLMNMKKNYFTSHELLVVKIRYCFFAMILLAVLPINIMKAQTTVFTDDFNANLTNYTSPSAGGTPKASYTTGSGSNGAVTYRLWAGSDYGLQIAGSGTAGNSFVYYDNSIYTYPYNASTGLHASTGLITWYFNFRNYGNSATYKSAVILGSSSNDFNSATGTGYAVYYNKTTTRRFSLAKYSAGVYGASITDVIPELSTDDLPSASNNDYCSVIVTYDPSTNNWSMFVRDDGVAAFNLPWTTLTTPVFVQHGSTVPDATYTTGTDNLKFSGYYYKYSTGGSSSYKATFDNFKITQVATAAPTIQSNSLVFSPIAITTLTANWTNGNGGKRIVVMNNSNSFTLPTNGVEPTANPVYGGSGEQVVYNGTGNSVNISGLTASTQYWFRIYDYSYGASFSPIYQTSTSTDNPNNVTTLGAVVIPTVSSPTATSITNNTVILGGNITSDGGAAITDRGTLWKTSSGVTISDNFLSEGGTTTGVFTSARTGLPSKILIYYTAYATNSAGTALSTEASFYTKADAPTTSPGTFAAVSGSDNSSMILSWTTATGADGYFIIQRVGAVAGGTAPTNGVGYTVGNILGTGTVMAIVTSGTTTTTTITGLASNTQYTYRIYPFAWDGTNAATLNYGTAASPDATGTTSLGTAVNNINSDIKLFVSNGKLILSEAADVYNTSGIKVASVKSNQYTELSLRRGVYIVKTATSTQKIIIP